jgi:hypothetical protein
MDEYTGAIYVASVTGATCVDGCTGVTPPDGSQGRPSLLAGASAVSGRRESVTESQQPLSYGLL